MTREVVNPLNTEWYRCAKCERSYFVPSGDPNLHLLKKTMRCPNHIRCGGRIARRSWSSCNGEVRNYRWTTGIELFQAAAGIGFASERDCSPETLTKLLYGARILATEVKQMSDPNKSLLLSLTLDNGRVVHLASSVHGPVVYKVTHAS